MDNDQNRTPAPPRPAIAQPQVVNGARVFDNAYAERVKSNAESAPNGAWQGDEFYDAGPSGAGTAAPHAVAPSATQTTAEKTIERDVEYATARFHEAQKAGPADYIKFLSYRSALECSDVLRESRRENELPPELRDRVALTAEIRNAGNTMLQIYAGSLRDGNGRSAEEDTNHISSIIDYFAKKDIQSKEQSIANSGFGPGQYERLAKDALDRYERNAQQELPKLQQQEPAENKSSAQAAIITYEQVIAKAKETPAPESALVKPTGQTMSSPLPA